LRISNSLAHDQLTAAMRGGIYMHPVNADLNTGAAIDTGFDRIILEKPPEKRAQE